MTRFAFTRRGISTSDATRRFNAQSPNPNSRPVPNPKPQCATFRPTPGVSYESRAAEGRISRGRGQDGDRAKRRTAASADLHGQRDHVCAGDRQALERGDVLESGHVALVEDTVRLEQRGLAVVDARGVDADGTDSPVGDQPSCGIRMQSGEVQLLRAFLAARRRAQIPRRIGPSSARSRSECSTIALSGIAPCSRSKRAKSSVVT